MSTESQESLTQLLLEYTDRADHSLMMEMLASAQKGLTDGANDFVDKASHSIQPGDLKSYLRCYPLAQALVSIAKFNDLNKDTKITRKFLELFLDSLEAEQLNKTLH